MLYGLMYRLSYLFAWLKLLRGRCEELKHTVNPGRVTNAASSVLSARKRADYLQKEAQAWDAFWLTYAQEATKADRQASVLEARIERLVRRGAWLNFLQIGSARLELGAARGRRDAYRKAERRTESRRDSYAHSARNAMPNAIARATR